MSVIINIINNERSNLGTEEPPLSNKSQLNLRDLQPHQEQIAQGNRFQFGANWAKFLQDLDDNAVKRAEESLKEMLEVDNLSGKAFLDIGSGSGLFSLAARNLGARVHSFDFDPQSVECTRRVKEMFYKFDSNWVVDEGSVLDIDYLESLGKFDIVYSWGVLHHTGAMWSALENININVANRGKVFIALYNDQGRASSYWLKIKKLYVRTPKILRFVIILPCLARLWGPTIIRDAASFQPLKTWSTYAKNRGMSPFRDVIDWVGGFPFEVSQPAEVFNFYKSLGYQLDKLKTCAGGLGCNEFVFLKKSNDGVANGLHL